MDWRILIVLLITIADITTSGQTEKDEVSSTTVTPMSEENTLANAVNDFGYKLMLKMMKRNNEFKNIALSPVGVAGVLAMALLGSVGKTYEELATILGFSQDVILNRESHEQFGRILEELSAVTASSQTQYADVVFVRARTRLRDAYRGYLQRVYHGDAITTNFTDSIEAKKAINEWMRNHTEGKIDEFLKDTLPENTNVVLLSALYFKGQWARPFVPEHTRKMPFKTPNREVMADLMLNFGHFKSVMSVKDGVHIISFPYNDSVTTMYALKPYASKNMNLSDVMNALDYAKIDNLMNEMSIKDYVIRFPKMELSTNTELSGSLKELGLTSIFSSQDANFALMIDRDETVNKTEDVEFTSRTKDARELNDILNSLPNPGVYVDLVLHDVKITLNEYGTEATAATAGALARTANMFYANTPFYIFIRDERTKLITFSAVINDPSI